MGLEPLHGQLLKQLAPHMGLYGYDPFMALQQQLYILQNGFAVSVAAHQVCLQELCRLLGERLGIAPGKHGDSAGVLPLGTAQPFAALLVAKVGHSAAVDDVDVCIFTLLHYGEPRPPEQLFQCAGLVQVDLTSQCIKTNSH